MASGQLGKLLSWTGQAEAQPEVAGTLAKLVDALTRAEYKEELSLPPGRDSVPPEKALPGK